MRSSDKYHDKGFNLLQSWYLPEEGGGQGAQTFGPPWKVGGLVLICFRMLVDPKRQR